MIRLAPGLVIALFVLAQPATPLKIVVLKGEDSVNVIQQKTATAPLIEVRDQNNVPVAGAVVKFAVQGGRAAAFQGGASTFTVATNAAGQAAAAGFTPLSAGAVNISVEAAFQGQIATAAITQVNVMTAAEAAAAAGTAGAGSATGGAGGSGAAAGGSGAAAGGGLSATTIGIVGGVAAAGAVVGTKALGGGAEKYFGTFTMTGTYTFPGCAHTDVYSGGLSIELESPESINGKAEIQDGTASVTASTCPGINVGRMGDGKWGMPDGRVSGTPASIVFNSQDNVPSLDGGGVTIARTFKFAGALSGTTINGQVDMVWTASSPGFPVVPMRTQITLTKQ